MTKTKIMAAWIPLSILLFGIAGGAAAQSQSWSKKIQNSTARFRVLIQFNSDAVLDKETGLVWQVVPSTMLWDWASAAAHCHSLKIGDRMGWRLPTFEELASLVDPTENDPPLPAGHPFEDIQADGYWSATTLPLSYDDPLVVIYAKYVELVADGLVGFADKNSDLYALCVRGGQGFDGGIH